MPVDWGAAGPDTSVVSREIARNGGRDKYRVHAAQRRADELVARPKRHKLEMGRRLHDAVALGWRLSGRRSRSRAG